MEKNELFDRYSSVLSRMDDACRRAGRARSEVRLVAVSKFHPADAVRDAASFGQKDFGENYVQEACGKIAELADLGLSWHAIGHIQSNKAKDIAGKFSLLHTMSSESLLKELGRRMPKGSVQDVLIEVNIGGEDQKSGIAPDALPAFAQKVAADPHFSLKGLMCIPPVCDSPAEARPYFEKMRLLRDALTAELAIPLPELSMGMSADFEAAIAEGATIVRVGTDIFGPRPIKV